MQRLLKATEPAVTPEQAAAGLLDALPPVMRFVRSHMRSHRNKGLSVPQFRTLVLLGSVPSANLSAVADFLGTTLPTASRIVSGLVAKGFVLRRESSSDRRQVELALTANGAGVMETARQATHALLAEELSKLGRDDLHAMQRAMSLLYGLFSPKLRAADEHPGARSRNSNE